MNDKFWDMVAYYKDEIEPSLTQSGYYVVYIKNGNYEVIRCDSLGEANQFVIEHCPPPYSYIGYHNVPIPNYRRKKNRIRPSKEERDRMNELIKHAMQ